ncbi:unnamed protein product [Angiostrongylus costaricensis]|uniref:BHLH domain-containing protein n=1 Tax=Angiostrongylus costaricensis TaxID=334426 RepID=A0A0R3PWZ2_ANGCS|nr:unnamed protein product [Angiostrongylus costaricensis]
MLNELYEPGKKDGVSLRSVNMENNRKNELIQEHVDRRRRAAWAAFEPLKEAIYQLARPNFRDHVFNLAVLPEICYAAET